MAQARGTIDFYGREVNIWNAQQLENLNAAVLRSRALDLRDLIDQNEVPRLPRHPEQVIQWILGVQEALPTLSRNTTYAAPQADTEKPVIARAQVDRRDERGPLGSPYGHGDTHADYTPISKSYASSRAPSHVGDQSEFLASYNEGRTVADAARMRSRGTSGLLSWD